jgi:hypothetical protein
LDGVTWENYDENQRKAVLNYLGYLPLYSTKISNTVRNQSKNGVPNALAIDNPWANTTNNIWLPTESPLVGKAIEGTTDALAKVVSNETFEGSNSAATRDWTFASGTPTTAAGGTPSTYLSQFLGTFANGAKTNGQDAWKTYTLDGNGGTVSFDFYRIDSWDNELFKVYANDTEILSQSFGWTNASTALAQGGANGYTWTITPKNDYDQHYGTTLFNDQTFHVTITVPTGVTSLKLGIGSNLDSPSNDESYGIDALSVVNAPLTYSIISTSNDPQALVLNGTNSYADLPDVNIGGDMTIEAWVKMDPVANNTWSRIVDIGNGSNRNGIVLCNEGSTGKLSLYTFDGNQAGNGVTTDEVLPKGRWVHLAAVLNTNQTVNIYVDGVLKKTGSVNYLPTDLTRTNTWVGKSAISGDADFNGSIRDLKLWNDARTYADLITPQGLKTVASFADGIGPYKDLILPRDASGDWTTPTSLVSDAHGAGLALHPWTFRAENNFLPTALRRGDASASDYLAQHGDLAAEIRKFIDLGVDGIFSDFPGLAVAARG